MIKFINIFLLLLLPVSAFAGGLDDAMDTSASALKAQGERIKVISENLANADTTGTAAGGAPYRRKMIFFEEDKDKKTNASMVKVKKVDYDNRDFKLVYQPNHPAANADGYVQYPNVDTPLESMDLRDAQRSYEANISAIENTKQMKERTLELMR